MIISLNIADFIIQGFLKVFKNSVVKGIGAVALVGVIITSMVYFVKGFMINSHLERELVYQSNFIHYFSLLALT